MSLINELIEISSLEAFKKIGSYEKLHSLIKGLILSEGFNHHSTKTSENFKVVNHVDKNQGILLQEMIFNDNPDETESFIITIPKKGITLEFMKSINDNLVLSNKKNLFNEDIIYYQKTIDL